MLSADRLFKRKGYVAATMAQIAAGATISESNLYVYFRSKFSILIALYEPWLRARIRRLEGRIERETDVRRRLHLILNTLWREIPRADNGFTNNLMQALTTTSRREGYRPDLLRWVEARVRAHAIGQRAASAALGTRGPRIRPPPDDGAGRICHELSSHAFRPEPQQSDRSR